MNRTHSFTFIYARGLTNGGLSFDCIVTVLTLDLEANVLFIYNEIKEQYSKQCLQIKTHKNPVNYMAVSLCCFIYAPTLNICRNDTVV